MEKKTVNLGYANGWKGGYPAELRTAMDAGYKVEETDYRHCDTGYRCETPDTVFVWRVDSSD